MLILSNEDIESFLSIKTCIAALENAYRSWDKGTAINRPRTDLVMPSSTEAGVYAFKSMEAGLYDPPVVAMRISTRRQISSPAMVRRGFEPMMPSMS